ncbi:MAG: pentapeptide repeat-containing protein [Polyangiaceae bacterium]|nr:pentapeptide repeat-containing protein [Polyangiaceae bacterium]
MLPEVSRAIQSHHGRHGRLDGPFATGPKVEAHLGGADAAGADLSGADLSRATLVAAYLSRGG